MRPTARDQIILVKLHVGLNSRQAKPPAPPVLREHLQGLVGQALSPAQIPDRITIRRRGCRAESAGSTARTRDDAKDQEHQVQKIRVESLVEQVADAIADESSPPAA
jgi:hypothetical protein